MTDGDYDEITYIRIKVDELERRVENLENYDNDAFGRFRHSIGNQLQGTIGPIRDDLTKIKYLIEPYKLIPQRVRKLESWKNSVESKQVGAEDQVKVVRSRIGDVSVILGIISVIIGIGIAASSYFIK